MGRFAASLVALFGLILAAVFAFYAVTPWMGHATPLTHSHIGDCVLYGALTAATLSAIMSVYQGKVWAWWTTVAFSIGLLFLAGWLLWTDGADAVFSFAVLTVPALMSLVVLLLRTTRTWFFKSIEQV